MAIDQKPPLPNFGPKNPQQPLNLEKIFNEERIDLKALMDSRKLTKEINKTLAPYTGEFGDAQKKHLLKRTMVGYASRHLKDLEGLTMEQAVDKIMTPHEIGEPVNNYYFETSAEEYKEKYKNDDVGPGEPFLDRPYVNWEGNGPIEIFGWERHTAYDSWVYHGMYAQPTSILWKFYVFMHNLTPVVRTSHKANYSYLKTLIDAPYRNYRDFIYDLTLEPTMLEYLNLQLSRKETPDENYAREVQELFTVGKRPFSRYTEGDVQSAARLLVGWQFDHYETHHSEGWKPAVYFRPWNHDTGDKQFSEFYGNRLIRGRQGDKGAEELGEFLDMIFETDEVAIYLSRRLFQFFVYPVLSDHIEEQIIKPMAEIMRSNGYNLSETLRVLLKSEYFYSEELYNSILKAPLDFTFSLYKEFDILNADLQMWVHEEQKQYVSIFEEDRGQFDPKFFDETYRIFKIFGHLQGRLNQQGMALFEPPSVSGWPAFYQEPVYDLFWLNSVTIKAKKGLTEPMARWGLYLEDRTNLRLKLGVFLDSFENAENLDSFISQLTDRFLGGPIPERAYIRIKKSVLGDQLNENYWTEAVTRYRSNPNRDNYNTLYHRLEQFMYLLFELNEMHVH